VRSTVGGRGTLLGHNYGEDRVHQEEKTKKMVNAIKDHGFPGMACKRKTPPYEKDLVPVRKRRREKNLTP